ncbi:hypothetical protein L3Q82_007813 [Scortum barcoo]|uniref:Uncharacterized protein n=1 Tax=Scortum barcoo TaxID=214431 RepID=A0ACB8WLM5_9TELE|nr:hypothetical protein L3Q82_007813 [Scortum barcoo]
MTCRIRGLLCRHSQIRSPGLTEKSVPNLKQRTDAYNSGDLEEYRKSRYALRRAISSSKRQYRDIIIPYHYHKVSQTAALSSSAGCGDSTWTPGSSAASTGAPYREYPDWLHHRLVHSSCTALNRKALQRVVKAAQHITRTELPSMEDLYTQRCRRKATKIIKDPSHPVATNCSACCRLADGSAAFEPEPPGSGTASYRRP